MYLSGKISVLALAGGLIAAGGAAQAGDLVLVNNGSQLKAAIQEANTDAAIETIRCASSGACDVSGILPTYEGKQRLVIDGNFSIVDAQGITDKAAFTAKGGGALKLQRLTFQGGMSGVYVEVPSDLTGTQRVELRRVVVRDAFLNGVDVDDSAGSDAGVTLILAGSKFIENGDGAAGEDGVYVDERGRGKVVVKVVKSRFLRNGSDGLSLDEEDGGNVKMTVIQSFFIENGHNPLNGSDPDDGIDIDEGGAGNVYATITDSKANKNADDGIDLDERQGGSLFTTIDGVTANYNLDQGLVFDERQNGDNIATAKDSSFLGNDKNSQGYDVRGDQLDQGSGSFTVENVAMGGHVLHGVDLIVIQP